MDATLKNALAQPAPWMFGAVRADFPTYTLRLLDGSAVLVIDGETYRGTDDVFGTIASVGEISEELGDDAPEITLTMYPPDITAAATLSHPDMQGSPVRFMVGALDPASGVVLGAPELLFLGEVDVPTVESSTEARTVEYSIVSVFERLFEVEEGQRASDGWHQSIWPGELGLEFMTATDVNLYWGAKPPAGRNVKGLSAAAAAVAASGAIIRAL